MIFILVIYLLTEETVEVLIEVMSIPCTSKVSQLMKMELGPSLEEGKTQKKTTTNTIMTLTKLTHFGARRTTNY